MKGLTSLIGSVKEADEFFQTAMIKIWMEYQAGRLKEDKIPAYTYIIAKRLFLDHKRKLKRDLKVMSDIDIDKLVEKEANNLYETHINPMILEEDRVREDADFQDKLKVVAEALDRIDTKCASLLKMTIVEKRRLSEVYEPLGFKSKEVAKASKYRCKKKFYKIIDDIKKEWGLMHLKLGL